jgi:hypothetical protein
MSGTTISTTVSRQVNPGTGSYAADLTLTSSGAIDSSGTYAVSFSASGILSNAGNITQTGTGTGVGFADGGTVVNGGSGIITGSKVGIHSTAGTLVINNTGNISGTSAYGVSVTGTGTTAGIITNGGNAIIYGGQAGINAADNLTVQNAGTITGPGVAGIFAKNANIYNNGASAVISGKNYGILVNSGYAITNAGAITGTKKYGVALLAGGTITNSGTITGGKDAVYNNSGSLTLIADPGAVFSGGVKDTPGGGELILGGSSTDSLNVSGFTGISTISFASGATWSLEGGTAQLASNDTITGFVLGDTIQLDGITATSSTFNNNTLTLLNGGSAVASLLVEEPGGLGNNGFTVSSSNGNTLIEEHPLCYLRGTRIRTPHGDQPIESLRIGDEVITRHAVPRRIKWIGRQSYSAAFVARNQDKHPVRITAGALDGTLPLRDLLVSPGHSLLLADRLILAKSLINGITIRQETPTTQLDYFNIELDQHDCILAEGAWGETYADAPGMRAQFHNAAEFAALYPDHVEVTDLTLCAPRPTAGPELEEALRPVAERAAALVTPGKLAGHVDIVTQTQITGWARDIAHPQLPVLLEIIAGHDVIGTVLACDPRGDLAEAGYGNAGFSVTLATKLPRWALSTLLIRRPVGGGAILYPQRKAG